MMLAIYGPTQTGKTGLAIKLAKKYNGEIISADSRQIYKNLDIGTGKVRFESDVEKHDGWWIVDGVKIHGFDIVQPGERFTVVDFLQFTNNSIIQIIKLNKLPIIVGGTGFYMNALIDGIDSIGIPANPKLRQKLEKLSTDALYQKLLQLSKNRAESMNESDRANPRRLIRAIEIASSNQKLNIKNQKVLTTNYELRTTNYLLIGLTAPNEFLFKKADKWLAERVDHGLIEEVKSLLKEGIDPKWLEDLGLEYRWITKYLLAETSYEESLIRLKGDIHSFIRRQKTWFPKFKNIKLFDISSENLAKSIEKTVSLWYTKENERGKTFT